MNRVLAGAAALMLAATLGSSALAADAGASKAKAKQTSTTRASKGKRPDPDDPVRAVGRKKALFMAGVDACDRPDRCDKEMVDGAEKLFVTACEVCASPEKCEAERQLIRAGKARESDNPCR